MSLEGSGGGPPPASASGAEEEEWGCDFVSVSVGEDELLKSPELRLWWPLVSGLAHSIADNRLAVRSTALSQLECILTEYGARFSTVVWELLLCEVLLPLMSKSVEDKTVQVSDTD